MSLEHAFPDRPLRRLVERRAGRFVSQADGSPHEHGHFELETIPAPPYGERVLVRDGDEVVEWSEVKCACSQCHCDVAFRFPGYRASYGFIRELMRADSDRYEAARRAVQLCADAEQSRRMTDRHLYAFDERDDG